MSKSVLIIGGTGMLGHKLAQVLGSDSSLNVHATVRSMPPPAFASPDTTYHTDVSLSGKATSLASVLDRIQPDIAVNAVGAIKQRDLKAHIDETFYLNGTLPHLIPLLGASDGPRMIHISTDCVFTGDRGGYAESDTPDAQDVYGRSKACGEIDYGTHLTLRTSIIGFELNHHLGLLGWLLRRERAATIKGYTRAIFSGLPTITLARLILRIIKKHEPLTGLYHVASEPIDKYKLLSRVNEVFQLGLEIVPDQAVSIDRSLDDTRIRQATGTRRPTWEDLIDELTQDFASWPYERVYPNASQP